MSKARIVITGYTNPDLDGTACAVAYAELLSKNERNAIAAFFGTPQEEAKYALNTFNVKNLPDAETELKKTDEVILVDASDTFGISNKIDPLNVIEVIDHRKLHQAEKFPNAKVQIQLVGACATLITEKFINSTVSIASSSAGLLHSAIVSNTVNFQANVTTDRDKDAAFWLSKKFILPEHHIHKMFVAKSQFNKPLLDVFEDYFATFLFNGKKVGSAQLEIIDTDAFIRQNNVKDTLNKIKNQKNLDYIFLTAIDVEKATNTFVVADEASQKLLEKTLKVNFNNGVAIKKGIMMRKTITPLIKDVLS